MNKTILSKLTFSDIGNNTALPSPYNDNNKYSTLIWSKGSTPTITVVDNKHMINISNVNYRLHSQNNYFSANYFIDNDFELDVNVRLSSINSMNGFYGVTLGTGNVWLSYYIKNKFIGGLTITSTSGNELSFNYKFEKDVDYNIIISFIGYKYRLIINGEIIGYIEKSDFKEMLRNTNTGLSMFVLGSVSVIANNANNLSTGQMWNINTSLGPGIKNEDASHLTKYGSNLLSRLNFDNLQSNSTSTVFTPNLESLFEPAVTWNYDSTKVNNYNVNTTFVTNINYDYLTLLIDMNNNKNMQDVKLIEYGNYKVIYNYISVGEPDPVVIVDNNTTSALDFENDLIDKVSTTVWNKEGTGNVTSVNKIFGDNSFETKALGDSLYTNSNIITGGSTPFTIEFYALIKPQESQLYTEGLVITDNRTLSIDKTTRNLMYSVGNSLGKIKIKYNELNKIMITFDGSATRVFVNDILDIVVGTNTGIASTIYSFLSKGDIGDEHWDNVVSLLHFDGDLTDASGKGTYTKSSSIAFVAEGKFNNCLYFSPSVNSDAVVTNDYSLWDFKGDDFTIDFFIKFETLTNGAILHGYGANSNSSFIMGIDNSNIYFDFRRVGNIYTSGVGFASPPINTWTHIAIVRNGDYFSAFVDGDRKAYQYVPYAMQTLNLPVRIGGHSFDSAFNGYIDELRITKGVARYTENFTPPPSNAFFTKGIIDNINIFDGIATKVRDHDPYEEFLVVDLAFDGENNSTKIVDNTNKYNIYDEYNDNIASLLHFNDGLKDDVGNQWEVLSGSPKINNNIILLNGSNLELSNIDEIKTNIDLGTEYTIECFILHPSSSLTSSYYEGIFSTASNNGLFFDIDNNLNLYIGANRGTVSISHDQVHHIALTRKNNQTNVFVDGVLVISAPYVFTTSNNLYLGSGVGREYLSARIDEFRITKGIARYTSNFNIPTEPFKYIPINKWSVNGNAKISTDQKFDGFSSLYLDGNGDYLTTKYKDIFDWIGDYTISFNIIVMSNSATKYILSHRGATGGSTGLGIALSDSNAISIVAWNASSNTALLGSTTKSLSINRNYKIDIIKSNMNWSIYIDGLLDVEITQTENIAINTNNNIFIGRDSSSNYQPARDFKGYIKNFKIYKGVAVIPESPVGKIQLDFDNNLNDLYNNSTWTNNGVTFDQVNSVKGYSAFFNGTSNISTAVNSNLNFENKNFNINMDIKPTAKTDWGVLIASNTSNVNTDESVIFWTTESNQNKMTLNMVNNSINYTTVGESGLLLNNYYNVNASVVNNVTNLKINDVIISQLPNLPTTRNFNFNFGDGTKIGTNVQNTSYVNYKGYIDNFSSIKDNMNYITKYENNVPSTSINLVVNDGLNISHTGTTVKNGTFVLNDSPTVKDYIVEVSGYIPTPNIGYLISFKSNTSDYSTMPNDATSGYSFALVANLVLIYKGQSNTSTVIIDNKPLPSKFRDGKYHIFKVVKSGNNIKLYIDDELISDVTDTSYSNNASTFAFSYSNSPDSGHTQRNTNIKYFKVYDLNMNILYDNHFKSNVNTIIDKASVHLPLETNSTNIGFTPLTINAVGNPTYSVVDGKKCIKFERGKYLSINSNNIFNLGTSSDFYIEFDIYPLLSTTVSDSLQTILSNNNMWSSTFESTQRLSMYINQSTNSIAFDLGARFSTGWLNIISLNEWNKITLSKEQNKVIFCGYEFYVNADFNLSISNLFIGVAGWDTSRYFADGYMSNFKMFVGTSEIPETYNDKKVLNLDFKPTRKSYLFKDNNNKCIIHPVNITQRDYQDSQYCCTFNGTDQYLELGKNDLFNFGLDDFVLYFKIGIDDINSNFNKDNMIISNNIAWATGYVGVSRYQNKVSIGIYGTTGFTSNNSFINGTNEFFIIKKDNILTIDLNGEKTVFENFSNQFNLNGNNSTRIGKAYDIANNTYFNGTIYSIKVLRNTTDLSLLEDVSSKFEESFTLTNGNESDNKVILNTERKSNHNIRFVKDETNTSLIVDGEFVEVQTVENTSTELKLFDGYNSNVKDVKLYDTAFIDDDIFLGNEPIDTVFGEIEYNEESEYELDIPEGDYTLKGFIEGYTDRDFFIYNTVLEYEIYRGTEYYDVNFMDEYSLDDYEINDLVTGAKYQVLKHEMIRGFISGTVNLKGCGVAAKDMKVYCYRDDTHRLIGIYSVDETGKYNIPNLDVNSKYDIIFKDETRKIKDQISNYRTPKVY